MFTASGSWSASIFFVPRTMSVRQSDFGTPTPHRNPFSTREKARTPSLFPPLSLSSAVATRLGKDKGWARASHAGSPRWQTPMLSPETPSALWARGKVSTLGRNRSGGHFWGRARPPFLQELLRRKVFFHKRSACHLAFSTHFCMLVLFTSLMPEPDGTRTVRSLTMVNLFVWSKLLEVWFSFFSAPCPSPFQLRTGPSRSRSPPQFQGAVLRDQNSSSPPLGAPQSQCTRRTTPTASGAFTSGTCSASARSRRPVEWGRGKEGWNAIPAECRFLGWSRGGRKCRPR